MTTPAIAIFSLGQERKKYRGQSRCAFSYYLFPFLLAAAAGVSVSIATHFLLPANDVVSSLLHVFIQTRRHADACEWMQRARHWERKERTSSSVLLLPGWSVIDAPSRVYYTAGALVTCPYASPSTRENSTNVSRHDLLPRRPLASLHRNKNKKWTEFPCFLFKWDTGDFLFDFHRKHHETCFCNFLRQNETDSFCTISLMRFSKSCLTSLGIVAALNKLARISNYSTQR